MRLLERDPEWIFHDGRIVGVRFICPVNDGAGPHLEGHAIAVLFANPPDGGPPHPDDPGCVGNNGGKRWTQASEIGLDDLTLSPSVDCTRGEGCPRDEHSSCSHTHCWHGFITGGEIK